MVALFAVFLWAVLAVPLATAQPPAYRSDRILVKPKPGVDLTALNGALGTKELRSFPAIGNLKIIGLPQHVPVSAILSRYQHSGLVQYAEPDWTIRYLSTTPDDYYYTNGALWGLNKISAPQAWDLQTDATNVIVAVVDVGARLTHEDLAANLWVNPADGTHGTNAVDGNNYPTNTDNTPLGGHGTWVSGIIGAVGNNGVGVAGVCWHVQLMECRFGVTTPTNAYGYVSDAIACFDFARANGAKIVNASWGDYTNPPVNGLLPDLETNRASFQALHDAVASLRDAGIILVAACGNDGRNNDPVECGIFPANFDYNDLDNVVAVAATEENDQLAWYSNHGAKSVLLAAPGGYGDGGSDDILSCWNQADNNYQYLAGTSPAAAHVSGACALVWAHYPNDNYRQIIHRVLMGTDYLTPLIGDCVTCGRLNLYGALTVVPGAWTNTGSMNNPHSYHTATLLPGGQVLVAGGNNNSHDTASTEIYDLAAGAWTASGSLNQPRYQHTATLLPNCDVLVAGGAHSGAGNGQVQPLASAELWDPNTGTWTNTGSMICQRYGHVATLVTNAAGSVYVLAAGGYGGVNGTSVTAGGSTALATAELYDPNAGTWSYTGSMTTNRAYAAGVLLTNGYVLVAGGLDQNSNALASAELYNPANGTWTLTGPLNTARSGAVATLLTNGCVLVAGGWNNSSGYLASAELYNPGAGTWTNTGSLLHAAPDTAVLLTSGQVLAAGGYNSTDGYTAAAELYDPTTGAWSNTGSMTQARAGSTATVLFNGKVLEAGGFNGTNSLSSAELYVP